MTLALVTPAAAAGHDIFVLHARPLREGADAGTQPPVHRGPLAV